MRALRAKKKVELSEKLESDVSTFLANGGVIYQATHEDTKMWRDRFAKKGPHIPMTVSEARMHNRFEIQRANTAKG